MRRVAALIALLSLAATAAPVQAASSARAWSTIDECRVAKQRSTIGVLAWMPAGAGARVHMYAVIQLQYAAGYGRWKTWRGGETQNISFGSANRAALRGVAVEVETPKTSELIRAKVSFTWRRAGRVVLRRSAVTRAHHPTRRYGSPVGYSSATCRI